MSLAPQYTEEYRRKVFDAWVLAGRCSVLRLVEIIPVNDQGNKPNHHTIREWMENEGWAEHADAISTAAVELADANLIQNKAEMLKQQYSDAVAIAAKAREAMVDRGFDTSAAAVSAYFKAVEEQRKVAGLAEFMEKVGNMTDEEIEKEIAERMARMKDAVVGEVVDRSDAGSGPENSNSDNE